jgi:NAD(P)-dependent dehydrogenase (short-subunit alcohol dehydrogenase family)
MNLKNKIILVTGGNGLIGKEIVSHLKKNKAIVVNAEINVQTNLLEGILNCDVTNEEEVLSAVEEVIKKFGRIDGLVNNAYPRTKDWNKKFEDIKLNSWQKNVDMQLGSVFLLCQNVIAHMVKQKSGSIVNIASIYGVVGNDFSIYENTDLTAPAAYSAIKGGIINFAKYLASYYGKDGIRINCISPGGIFNNQDPVFVKNYESKVPLKRMGKPSDIAPSVAFLLSDEASYITGHNLVIDGGWTAI